MPTRNERGVAIVEDGTSLVHFSIDEEAGEVTATCLGCGGGSTASLKPGGPHLRLEHKPDCPPLTLDMFANQGGTLIAN